VDLPLDVFGLGQCAYDRLALVDAFAAPDGKQEAAAMVEQTGGPVATALAALARWGRRTAFSGVVGDDPEGARIAADLGADGVDVARLLVRPGHRSQIAFVAVERGTGRRTITWRRPTGAPPSLAECAPPPARVYLTDGLYTASLACARCAPEIVVDAGTLREGTRAMLRVATAFVASEAFARAFTGDDDPDGACRKIAEHGPPVAAVTLGARGWVARIGRAMVRGTAYAVDAVDTTGCGDVFHAGFVEGLLRGWPPERGLDLGAWAAAQAATRLGNRAGVPSPSAYPGTGAVSSTGSP
jgi:ribokinase